MVRETIAAPLVDRAIIELVAPDGVQLAVQGLVCNQSQPTNFAWTIRGTSLVETAGGTGLGFTLQPAGTQVLTRDGEIAAVPGGCALVDAAGVGGETAIVHPRVVLRNNDVLAVVAIAAQAALDITFWGSIWPLDVDLSQIPSLW